MVPKISIIVPAYNAQDTIKRCLNSLLKQTYSNYIIYIIDDGSIDNTINVLKNYINNSKIKVIQQSNLGVSAARNCGLLRVHTKYVAFVDADDYVNENYLKDLYNNFLNDSIDMTICSWVTVDNLGKKVKYIQNNEVYGAHEMLKMLLTKNGPHGYLWNKLFKMKIIHRSHLKFDTSISVAEDMLFCYQYLLLSNKICTISNADYIYNLFLGDTNDGINLKNGNIKFYINYLNSLEKIFKIIPDSYKDVSIEVGAYVCSISCDLIRMINLNNLSVKSLKKRIIKKAKKNMHLLLRSSYIEKKRILVYFLTIYFPHFMKALDVLKLHKKLIIK